MTTEVQILAIYVFIHQLPIWVLSHTLFHLVLLVQDELECPWEVVWLFDGFIISNQIKQLLPMPYICIQCLQLFKTYIVTIPIWHVAKHYNNHCIWLLWEVSSRMFGCMHFQSWHGALDPSCFHVPHHLNFEGTILWPHLNAILPNVVSTRRCSIGSQHVNVTEWCVTAITLSCGLWYCWARWFWLFAVPWWCFSWYLATYRFSHLFQPGKVG